MATIVTTATSKPTVIWEQPSSNFIPAQAAGGQDPRDFHPWHYVVRLVLQRATGTVYDMRTPCGNEIQVWIPGKKNAQDHDIEPDYVCHGWGLGTYNRDIHAGYTIFSTFVHLVLLDPALFHTVVDLPSPEDKETRSIRALNPNANPDPQNHVRNIRQGDVVAWWGQSDQTPNVHRVLPADSFRRDSVLVCMHTAVIKVPAFESRTTNGATKWYLFNITTMTSKNGASRFKEDTTLLSEQ